MKLSQFLKSLLEISIKTSPTTDHTRNMFYQLISCKYLQHTSFLLMFFLISHNRNCYSVFTSLNCFINWWESDHNFNMQCAIETPWQRSTPSPWKIIWRPLRGLRYSHQKYSVKKVFLKVSQNLQENTCVSLFYNKIAGLRLVLLLKKRHQYRQGRSVTTLTRGVQHPGFTDEHVALQAHLVK